MFYKVKQLLHYLVLKESCLHRLTLSFCVGIFIALSPFIGFHNIMIVIASWVLQLNFPVIFLVAHLINNPWTVAPLMAGEYYFGKWVLYSCGITYQFENPAWISSINNLLNHYLGVPCICFWTLFIGANLMAIVLSVILYPIMKYVFSVVATQIRSKRGFLP